MKPFAEFVEEFDILIYRSFENTFNAFPEKRRRVWIFLALGLLLLTITLIDIRLDYKVNFRPLLILPVLICAAFTSRPFSYSLALFASIQWTQAFRIKVIPDDGGFDTFMNWFVAFFALLCVAEFSSLAVNTIRNLADYILSIEKQTRELESVCADENESDMENNEG